MNSKNRLFSVIGIASFVLFVFAGCGGSDLECGENTLAEDGECVPNTAQVRSCGEGTQVDPDTGECVLATGGCGPNATFDAEGGRCVVADSACAEGTEFDAESGRCIGVTGCGDNTIKNDDGTCVPDVGTLCANQPGVRYDPESGKCTVGTASCGPGTQLSAESGTCVISDAACGQGLTINNDGDCVPTDEVCGDQSTLASVDGNQVCVPNASCQEGDVVLSAGTGQPGVCVEPAEALADNPDMRESEQPDNSTEANNDFYRGGEPDRFALKPVGETLSIVGTVGPPRDLDGDDEPDPDVDSFRFRGEAGQWLSLSVQSLGMPQPWFEILGPNGFERESAYGEANAVREVLLPYDGTYRIDIVATQFAWSDTIAGDPSWGYVMGVEQFAAPDPVDNDFTANNVQGTITTLRDNVYRIQGFQPGDLMDFSFASIGSSVSGDQGTPALQIWSDPNTLSRVTTLEAGETTTVPYPPSANPGEAILVVDWIWASGPNLSYDLGAQSATGVQNVGQLSSGQTTTTQPIDVPEDGSPTYRFTVPGGHFLEITHTNDNDHPIEYDIDGISRSYFASASGYPVVSDLASFENDEGYHYFPATTEVVIQIQPYESCGFFGCFPPAEPLPNFTMDLTAVEPNTTVTNMQPGDELIEIYSSSADPNRSDWHLFSIDQTVFLQDFDVRALQPNSGNADFEAEVSLLESDGDLDSLASADNGDGSDDTNVPLGAEFDQFERFLQPGTYILRVGMEDTPINEYRIDAQFGTLPPGESEPNDSTGTADSADLGTEYFGQISSSDTDHHTFTLDSDVGSGEYLELNAFTDFDDLDCEVLDSSGNTVSPAQSISDDNCILRFNSLSAGTYTWRVNTSEDDQIVYFYSIRRQTGSIEVEPNDTQANAMAATLGTGTLGAISGSDTDYFDYTLSSALGPNEILHVDLNQTGGFASNDYHCNLLDSSGTVVAEYQANDEGGDDGCDILYSGASAATYTVEVLFDTGSVNYNLTTSRKAGYLESEPNDTQSAANAIAFSDFSTGVPIWGDAIFDPGSNTTASANPDVFEITGTGSASPFELQCEVVADDAHELDWTLTDGSGNQLAQDTSTSSTTLSTGSFSSSSLYLTIEDGDIIDNNTYRCAYQTP